VCVCVNSVLWWTLTCVCLVCVCTALSGGHTRGKCPRHFTWPSSLVSSQVSPSPDCLSSPPLSPRPLLPLCLKIICVCVCGGGLWRPLIQTLRPSVRHLFSLTHARGRGVVEQASFRWCTTPASKRSSLPLMLVLFHFIFSIVCVSVRVRA